MKVRGRKLLSATVGVATVSYVIACGETSPAGSRSGGQESAGSGGAFPIVGNLPSPPPYAGQGGVYSVGNLVAPPVAGQGGYFNAAGAGGANEQIDAGDDASDDAGMNGSADAASLVDADSADAEWSDASD